MLYDIGGVNAKMSFRKIPEVLGLAALAKVLCGLRAPWRQNETVDSVWEHIGISNKTATIQHRDPKQRSFHLGKHKFDHFCHWVIASYGDEDDFTKVAIIPAALHYLT